VVGVGKCSSRELPGLVPFQPGVVKENPHQFWDGQSWMRVVELDGSLLRQRRPVRVGTPKPPQQVREGASHQEVFLHQTEPFAHIRRVVRVEHAGERLRSEPLGQRTDEIAAAESLEVEVVRRCCGPEPQRIDGLAAVTDDRPVQGNADQGGRSAGNGVESAAA
jgi:hypothetical protein